MKVSHGRQERAGGAAEREFRLAAVSELPSRILSPATLLSHLTKTRK